MTRHLSWPSYRLPLVLTVTDLAVDGAALPDLVRSADERVVLCELDNWTSATLSLRLSSEESLPEGLSPESLVASACLRSESGMSRIPVKLNPVGEGTAYEGHLSFSRDEVGGVATLTSELAEIDHEPMARIIGESRPWAVPVDVLERPPRHGGAPLPSEWIDFSDPPSSLAFLVDYAEVPVYVSLEAEPPQVFFNSNLGRLQSILQHDSAQLERRRTRDLIAGQIALHVTTVLLRAGFSQVGREDDGTIREPSSPTVQRVFDAVTRLMPASDSQSVYESLADADDDEKARIWGELQLAAMLMVGMGDDLERITKEVYVGG